MNSSKIICVVGARPNFIKMAPFQAAFQQYPNISLCWVHTGQHFDEQMSTVFFEQLEMPNPDYHLDVSGGSQVQQTARIMLALEPVLEKEQADLVMAAGDVNSTLAAALTAAKMSIPIAHVEAGLRSGDRRMPEEINRILTDSVSDLLFVSEASGLAHLKKEGVPAEKVFFTGNCMIDTLLRHQRSSAAPSVLEALGLAAKSYLLLTLHRPSNVDNRAGQKTILRLIEQIAGQIRVVFPIHPFTRLNFEKQGHYKALKNIQNLELLEPQGYLEFQQLLSNAVGVLTDSGGIQEEATFLHVPCLTFRENTERPVTVETGTNELLATLDPEMANQKVKQILAGKWKAGKTPELWDGKAAERIAAVIHRFLSR